MMKTEVVSNLKHFGMNEYEAKSYAALIKKGPQTASSISEYSKVPQSKIYEVMRSLQSKAFIECFDTKPQKFKAIDPSFAFKGLLKRRKQAIKNLEERSKKIINILKTNEPANEQEVWVSKGKDIFLRKMVEAVNNASGEIKMMSTDFIRDIDLDEALMRANKKSKIRILAPMNISESSKVRASWYEKIAKIKMVEAPDHNFIISNNTAYIMTSNKPEFTFVTSSNKAIVNAVNHYFEHLWQCGGNFSD